MDEQQAAWMTILRERQNAIRGAQLERREARDKETRAVEDLGMAMASEHPEWVILTEILPSGIARLTIVDRKALERELDKHVG